MLDREASDRQAADPVTILESMIWDRKLEGGFPETKELKNRVRNIIEPGRDLGHIDRSLKKKQAESAQQDEQNQVATSSTESATTGYTPQAPTKLEENKSVQECEDCK
jgi:hypothetical protein